MKRIAISVLFLVVFLMGISAQQSYAQSFSVPTGNELKNAGVGLYTDPSVASQVSTFTINPNQVSCGVGTVNAEGLFGPFEMIMYSTQINSYRSQSNTILADGCVIHPFIAVATDNAPGFPQPNLRDRFETHFITPFWHVGNPLCTASERVPGGCRFGGQVFLGDVDANP
jgi:hypothetical protein